LTIQEQDKRQVASKSSVGTESRRYV